MWHTMAFNRRLGNTSWLTDTSLALQKEKIAEGCIQCAKEKNIKSEQDPDFETNTPTLKRP